MSTLALGALSFSDTPDVNGALVLTDLTGILAGNVTGTANQIVVTGTSSPVISLAANPVLTGTSGFVVPTGTTAQRPGSPAVGTQRFNTTTGDLEVYTGAYWAVFGQTLQVVSGTITNTTTTTQVPWDNTVPLSTEGTQIWSTTFTPLSATSRIRIAYSIIVSTTTAARAATTSVFAGTTNIGSSGTYMATANQPFNLFLQIVYSPGSTAAITLSARCGQNGTGTHGINQANGNNLGGAAISEYSITEIA